MSDRARGARFESVDQLRGLAALAVVACHLSVSAYVDVPNRGEPHWPLLALVLGFGYIGVPLFFVISGFCIHLPQARARAVDRDHLPDWRAFFRRRFWRLYPPYVAALGLGLLLPIVLFQSRSAELGDVLAHLALVQTLIPRYFDGINPPAWTLAVEAQFYLAYPLVYLLVVRLGAWRALGVVLLTTLGFRFALEFSPLPSANNAVLWEFFLARWFEWTCGVLVAEWVSGGAELPRVLRYWLVGVLVLGLAVWSEWHSWHYHIYLVRELLYGVGFAVCLAAALSGDRAPGRTRLGRYLRDVGIYSYSLYLVHRPIQFAFEPLASRVAALPFVIEHRVPSSLIIMAATTPLVLWSARLFFRWFEQPFLVRARRPGGARAAAATVGQAA